MPKFDIDLSDGRTVTIESDHEPTEDEVLASIQSQPQPEPAPAPVSPLASQGIPGMDGLIMPQLDDSLLPVVDPNYRPETPAERQGIGRFGQAFVGGLASIPEAASIIAEKPAAFMESIFPLEGGVPRNARENLLYQSGQQLRNEAASVFPIDPQRPKSFVADTLPSGAGSMASFITGGAALKGSKLLTTPGQIAGGVAALGAATGGAEAYREAIEKGADDDTAFKVFAANAALGTTEAVPIAGWLNRLNKASGNKLKQAIIEGSEEAAQEVFQQFGGNLVASKTFDPDRKLTGGTGEGAAAGFTLGSLMSLVVSAIGGRRAGLSGVEPPPVPTEPVPPRPVEPPPVPTEPVPPRERKTDAVFTEGQKIPGNVQQPEVAQEGAVEVPTEIRSEETTEALTPEVTPTPPVQDTPAKTDRVADEDLSVVVQSPGKLGDTDTPGYVQVDSMRGGKNEWSSNPNTLNAAGYKLPTTKMFLSLPQGKYTMPQALQMLKEKALNELVTAVKLKGKVFTDPDKGHIKIALDSGVEDAVQEVSKPENQGFVYNGDFISREDASILLGEKLPLQSERLKELRAQRKKVGETIEETKEKEVLTETAATEPVPMAEGLGGASAGFGPIGTGLKNVVGEQERVAFGLPEAYPTISRKMLPVWNASAEVLRQDPEAGAKLAAELKINPERGMTDEDSALLLRHKVALEHAQNQAAEDSITGTTPEAKQEALDRYDNISNQLLDLLDAAKFRGSQWGREGRWRQALAFEDYSLETMRRQKRLKADRDLTPEEEAETKREHETITAKQKEAEEARARDEKKGKEADVKEAVTEAVKTAKTRQAKQKAAGVVRDLEAEQRDIIGFLKETFIESGDLSDTRSSIKKLMELLVEREGITERLPLEDRVHEILSGVDPTLTREGTLDLMSGYGKSKLPSQEPAKKIVRDISQQIISVRKLLDYFKGKRPSLTGMLRDAPSDIQRGWLKMVNEAKKVFKLEATGDNAQAIKSATDAVNTRLKNRIKDLKQEIVTRQKIIRERSPTPYNAETLRLRQELELLQAQHAEIFGSGLTPAEQLARLEKSAERQIAELERQIRTGEIFPRSQQAIGLTSDKLDAAKAQIEELKLQRQFAREALQPKTEPEVAKNEARVKALDKQIATIENQLADDAVFTKPKKERTPSEDARIVEREKRLAELKQERQFARERNQPGMEQHERFLLNYLLRIRQREAAYKEKLAKGEFEKVPKPKRELSPDVLKALADVEKAKSDFQRGLHKYEQERRSRIQKIWDGIKATRNAFVNIISSYDFSAPRQAFSAVLSNVSRLVTNPVGGAKLLGVPFQKMFSAWSSENRSQAIDQWRKNRPNALSGADKTAGIQYTDLHSETFSKREENARSVLDDWAALPLRTGNAAKTAVTAVPKVLAKGVRMSNRAFITYLNTTRALLFDELLKANFQDRAPTEAQLKVLGNLVNIMTGRGAISPKAAEVASNVLWAPSLLTSRVQLLTGQPFWGKAGREGGGKARLIVAKEYARIITSGALLFAISQMFDDNDDDEMTSSDFGKVVRGKTRIDPWAGHQQVAVLMARLKRGETTSISGDTRDISKIGQGEVIWNFFKNKTRPDIVAAVNAAIAVIDRNKEPGKARVTPAEAVKGAVPVPLAIREVIEVMRDRGMTEGAIIEALALFGAGVSVYEDREYQK